MVRVGKTQSRKLVKARNSAWASFTARGADCLRDQMDRAANRPVSIWAAQRSLDRDLYMRMYERADSAARRCGV